MNCIDRLIQYLCGKKKVNDNKNDNDNDIDESTYDFLNKKKGDYQDCVICLEPLNESIIDACHKCNVKCHMQCLYEWYRSQKDEICPICLESENYYLQVLENPSNDNINNNINNNRQNTNEIVTQNSINNIHNIRIAPFSFRENEENSCKCYIWAFGCCLLIFVLVFSIK